MPRFVPPPPGLYDAPGLDYLGLGPSYGWYNYLRPGLASWVKRRHFGQAIALADAALGSGCRETRVIDLGCADGVFFPTLTHHYRRVIGIERDPRFVGLAARCAESCGAAFIDNRDTSWDELRATIGRGWSALFLLEVLEHVGEPGATRESIYEEKITFLERALGLLDPGGVAVISVPNMVGIAFLTQRAALWAMRGWREPISRRELWRVGVLADASCVEARWAGHHLGFSHRWLEEAMRARGFRWRRRHIGWQVLYALASAAAGGDRQA